MDKLKNFFHRIFFSKDGKLVIIQRPNLPLLLWFITAIISNLLNEGETKSIFIWISTASLIIWSILEIISGANYFRKCLGIIILLILVINRIIISNYLMG